MMRTAVLLAIIALASAAAAGETSWSQTVAEWLDHYDLVVGRYTRTDFTSHQGKRGASCEIRGKSMLRCSKKGSSSFESASFDSDGRAHYFSLTLTTEESRERCAEIGKYLATKYGTPSYGIKGGGGGYNFPKNRRHIEFGPTRDVAGCVLSIQAGVRSK